MDHRPTLTARPPSRSRLRAALLLAVVVALAMLALVVDADPGRVGIFPGLPGLPGRTAGPSEPGWVLGAPAPIALTEVAAAAHDGRIGWRVLTSLSAPREHLAATSLGAGSVTFVGGRVGGLGGNLGTVDLVSAEGVVGRTEDLTTARGGIAAFSTTTLGDCVVGGEGPEGTFGVVECIGAIHRTTLPGLTVPRHGLGAVVVDGRAYALLGGRQPGLTVSDVVEVLDLR